MAFTNEQIERHNEKQRQLSENAITLHGKTYSATKGPKALQIWRLTKDGFLLLGDVKHEFVAGTRAIDAMRAFGRHGYKHGYQSKNTPNCGKLVNKWRIKGIFNPIFDK